MPLLGLALPLISGVRRLCMKRIYPNDLIAVRSNDTYYYALILSPVKLFGGNWSYAFHRTSDSLLAQEEIMQGSYAGFHSFIDFIWAKRENRLIRIAKKLNTEAYTGPGFLKTTFATKEKAAQWSIYDMEFKEVKRVSTLTNEEAKYPLFSCIDDVLMVQRINEQWLPEKDQRI